MARLCQFSSSSKRVNKPVETKGLFRFVMIFTERYFISVERNSLPLGETHVHKSSKLVFTVIPSSTKQSKNMHFMV